MNLQILKDLAAVASKFVPNNQKQAVADMLYQLAEEATIRAENAERELVAMRQQLATIHDNVLALKKAEQIEAIADAADVAPETVADIINEVEVEV